MTKAKDFDIADHLETNNDIAEFLNIIFNDHGIDAMLGAVNTAIRAKGVSVISKKTGLSRESLYKTFKQGKHPQMDTVVKVLDALNVSIQFKAA